MRRTENKKEKRGWSRDEGTPCRLVAWSGEETLSFPGPRALRLEEKRSTLPALPPTQAAPKGRATLCEGLRG